MASNVFACVHSQSGADGIPLAGIFARPGVWNRKYDGLLPSEGAATEAA